MESRVKPGWKTTEFWLTSIFMVGVFVLLGLGRMELSQVVDLWPIAAGIFGFSMSRGAAKFGGDQVP